MKPVSFLRTAKCKKAITHEHLGEAALPDHLHELEVVGQHGLGLVDQDLRVVRLQHQMVRQRLERPRILLEGLTFNTR